MIMPANYSVIAENELSYVDGGWVNLMKWDVFEKNMVTIIGNRYATSVATAMLGGLFNGNKNQKWEIKTATDMWKDLFMVGDKYKKPTEGTEGNETERTANVEGFGWAMKWTTNALGVAAGIWSLGTYPVKALVNDKAITSSDISDVA